MPPEIKAERKAMVDAAVAVIDESGAETLSARTLAKRLGISTQPIYREFGDMDGLKKAATERAYEMLWEYIKGDALDQAVKYVMFACEHRNLFKFLACDSKETFDGLDDLAHRLMPSTDIIDRLTEITGLKRERVYRLHLYLWMALSGIAHCAVYNDIALKSDELKDFTTELTKALTKYYRETDNGRA